ncbi:MAG: hypothetical protein HQ483_14560 [Rhodospirillales bacterium]|nr:hypothetical protein [Rhodospirillales bacterium]
MSKTKIKKIQARKLRDMTGQPAIEIDVLLRYGAHGRVATALPPSAHRPSAEIDSCIAYINDRLHSQLKGKSAHDQSAVDQWLADAGCGAEANPLLAPVLNTVSSACLWAMADTEKLPLWQYLGTFLGQGPADTLPLPTLTVYTAQQLGSGPRCIERFSVIPVGAGSFAEALNWAESVRTEALQSVIEPGAGDEQILKILIRAIEKVRLRPAQDMGIAIKIATPASRQQGHYQFHGQDSLFSTDTLSGKFVDWVSTYPIVSIEDPFADDDLEGYRRLTWAAGKRVQVIANPEMGPGLFAATDGVFKNAGNALRLSANRSQSISDIRSLKQLADQGAASCLLPLALGGQLQTTAIHLAVGWGVPQICTAPDKTATTMLNWNEGQRIAEILSAISPESCPVDGGLPARRGFAWG